MSTTNHIHEINEWFRRAVPAPTDSQRCMQIGVHLEEVGEMMEALGGDTEGIGEIEETWKEVAKSESESDYYANEYVHRTALLDALCDQIVTAIGVAHMYGFDISGALAEVNRANWSKFDADGKPVFNEQGKISKGPNYTPPDLAGFLGMQNGWKTAP